ncbi:GNAT family N-acetyltransferase [Staphylococcus sp. SQ8-PEA]|uniref:GCN5-related N-acetyltransferase n=1 Tax=Staphylococcus marylandisciuri TaxID=2981529 RepID=A0ABT2QQ00_9STAP|nr:GNAT family N-acetyltransferase [Staphylococcus marylandisciuri]MCU5746030.1 GNAT family N-acetyltransferase [Staphylococcus marylandisciuri]
MFRIVRTKDELADAFSIRKEVFVEEQHIPIENELDQFEEICTHIIGYIDEQPFAVARIRAIDNQAKIERVAITKPYRKQGRGHTLMKYVETIASEQGYTAIVLNAQYSAKDFYHNLGYQVSGEIFLEEGIQHIRMSKQL